MDQKSCEYEQKILRRNCLILTLRASRKSLLETRLSLPQIYTIWQTKVFLSSPSKWLLLMTQYFDEEQTGFGNNFERKPSSISSLSHSLKWFLHIFFLRWKTKFWFCPAIFTDNPIKWRDHHHSRWPRLGEMKKDRFFPGILSDSIFLENDTWKYTMCENATFCLKVVF